MRLGITRAQSQFDHLMDKAAIKGIELVSLPIIKTEAVNFDWPVRFETTGKVWIMFTSSNAVNYFFEQLDNLDGSLPDDYSIAAVGKKTAERVKQFGYSVSFIPSDTYGELLFTEFADHVAKAGDLVIFPRGEKVNFEPAEILDNAKIIYIPIVCYKTLKIDVSKEQTGQFKSDDYILFTAPSTVNAYHNQHGQPVAKPIALGRSTASAMNEFGWYGFVTMKKADIDTVLEYL